MWHIVSRQFCDVGGGSIKDNHFSCKASCNLREPHASKTKKLSRLVYDIPTAFEIVKNTMSVMYLHKCSSL